MTNIILSINAGSSSLKTTLFLEVDEGQQKNLKRLASAEISAINQPPAKFKYVRGSEKKTSEAGAIHNHAEAFSYVLDAFLSDSEIPEVSSKEDIHYACHRTVQGGDFEEDQLLTRDTFHKIEKLSDLAPLYATFLSRNICWMLTKLYTDTTHPPSVS